MEKKIAKDLLSIGAVFLRPEQPFTWASGIKSPIYCDNRLTLTAVEVRRHVEAGLAEIVRTKYPEAQVLMGTSTAGIAHAAITATLLDLPMGYVRSGAKDHGRGNRIEGKLEKGQKVVVIEDLVSTGGSSLKAVEAIRNAGEPVNAIPIVLPILSILGAVALWLYSEKLDDRITGVATFVLAVLMAISIVMLLVARIDVMGDLLNPIEHSAAQIKTVNVAIIAIVFNALSFVA